MHHILNHKQPKIPESPIKSRLSEGSTWKEGVQHVWKEKRIRNCSSALWRDWTVCKRLSMQTGTGCRYADNHQDKTWNNCHTSKEQDSVNQCNGRIKFMQKYHGNAASTGKGIKKYFLVIRYDKGMLAFWGTAKEYGQFVKMQFGQTAAPSHISL